MSLPTVLVAAVVLLAGAASAGQAPVKAAGEEVIVTHAGSGQELRGRLVDLSSTSLAILVDGRRVEVPIDDVLRIDGRYDSVKDGAIIGAVVGAALSALSCATYSDYTGPCTPGILVESGFGALIGAGIDALHKGRSPIYVRTAGKSGTALQVQIRF